MAFKDKIKFGKHEIDVISAIRKVHFASGNSPIVAEKHTFPDLDTYNQIKDEIRGFKVDAEGNPQLDANGKKIGVTKSLDYEKEVKITQLNSRNLENDKAFREELMALCYKYFGEGMEKI